MDVDLHGPDIPHMMGLSGMLTTDNTRKMVPISYSDHLKIISMESLMPNRDEAVIWRGPVKHSAIRQFIGDVNWGNLDFLIIDSPPGTGDEPLTVAQLIPEAKAVIVTTPQEVALSDIRKSISFCKNVRMEIFGIIENMSGFTCPHCGEMVDLFGTGGGKKPHRTMASPSWEKLPLIRKWSNAVIAAWRFSRNSPNHPLRCISGNCRQNGRIT